MSSGQAAQETGYSAEAAEPSGGTGSALAYPFLFSFNPDVARGVFQWGQAVAVALLHLLDWHLGPERIGVFPLTSEGFRVGRGVMGIDPA